MSENQSHESHDEPPPILGSWRRVYTAVLLYLLILLGFWIADINDDRFIITDRDFIFITASLGVSVLLFRIWFVIVGGVLARVPEFPELSLVLLFPVAAVAMNARFLINFKVSLVMTAIISILFGMLSDLGLIFTAYTFVVSLVAIHTVGGCSRSRTPWGSNNSIIIHFKPKNDNIVI